MKEERKAVRNKKSEQSQSDQRQGVKRKLAAHDQKVTNFVIHGLHPFSIVEEEHFRKMFPDTKVKMNFFPPSCYI